MRGFRTATFRLKRAPVALLALLTACFQNTSGTIAGKKAAENAAANPPSTVSNGKLTMEWGRAEVIKSGEIVTKGSIRVFDMENSTVVCRDGKAASTNLRKVCFDNNSTNGCEVAVCDVRVDPLVLNSPVAIRSFRLNFNKVKFSNVQLSEAWVTTAELRFPPDLKGQPFFANVQKSNLAGSGNCNLGDGNSVGFDSSKAGQERFLTGLYLVDDLGTLVEGTGSTFDGSRMTAAEIAYTGIIPDPPSNGSYGYDVIPRMNSGQAVPSSFVGKETFSSQTTQSVLASPQFGAGDALNVIVGFCIKGTKTEGSVTRQLLPYVATVTHRPRLILQAPTTTPASK